MSTQVQPIHLVSVNKTPDRARQLLATVIEAADIKAQYNLVHAGNTTTVEGVRSFLLSLSPAPQLLICSSQWTPEQQDEVQRAAKETISGLKTAAIPAGLDAAKGGDAVIGWLKEMIFNVGIPRRA